MYTVQFEVSNFSVATQYQINYQFVIRFYSCKTQYCNIVSHKRPKMRSKLILPDVNAFHYKKKKNIYIGVHVHVQSILDK